MRISDWSSDVCSSDLGQHRCGRVCSHLVLQWVSPCRPALARHRHGITTGKAATGRRQYAEFSTGQLLPHAAGARPEPARECEMAGLTTVRIRSALSYDGTDLKGWALQPALRPVQAEPARARAVAPRPHASRVVQGKSRSVRVQLRRARVN